MFSVPQIHTQTIEGAWKHAKAHLKEGGTGTRRHMIQERLDEFIFHRTYLRDQPMNVWIMLRLLAKYGNKAYDFVANYHVDEKEFYRAEEIGDTDEEDEQNEGNNDNVNENQAWEDRDWVMDDDGNLVHYNDSGQVDDILYLNPDDDPNEQPDDYEEDYDLTFNVNEVDPQLVNRLNNL